jgi:hypothetical protein
MYDAIAVLWRSHGRIEMAWEVNCFVFTTSFVPHDTIKLRIGVQAPTFNVKATRNLLMLLNGSDD